MNKCEDAVEWYEKSRQIRVELYGETHEKVAEACKEVAEYFSELNQYESALEWFDKALRHSHSTINKIMFLIFVYFSINTVIRF